MAGRVHEFQQGVLPPKSPIFGRRVNDRIFTGPRGSVMRYGASTAALDVLRTPYNVS